jgi:hypothetical protein
MMKSTGGYRRLPKPIRNPIAVGLWSDGTPVVLARKAKE